MRYISLFLFLFAVSIPFGVGAQGTPTQQQIQQYGLGGNSTDGQNIQNSSASNSSQLSQWFSQASGQVSTIQNNQQLVQSYVVDANFAATQGYYPGGLPMNTILSVQNPSPQNQYGNTMAPSDTALACRNIQIKNIATLSDFVRCTISNSLIPLAIAFGMLFLAWGITMLVLNAGNEEAREKGKNLMVWGLIGFFVIAATWALVGILLNTFQLDNKTKAPIPCFQTGTC